MIKRFIITLISALCFVIPANANVKINPEAIDSAVKEFFPQKKDAASALVTFKENLEQDGSISAQNFWKVCKAAGLNVDKKQDDKQKCQKFVNKVLRSGDFGFKHVCFGNHTGYEKLCDKNTFKSLNVTRDNATGLIEEFVRIKHSDDIKCSNVHVTVSNDDYIACVSKNINKYYDFRFDDVKESIDNRIYKDTMHGICIIHDKKYKNIDSKEAICMNANEKDCENIKETAKKFGFTANFKDNACKLNSLKKTSDDNLRTQLIINGNIYEMDAYAFRQEDIQVNSLDTINDSICDYIAYKIQPNEYSSCRCIKGFTEYKIKQAIKDEKDNLKTCTVSGPKSSEKDQKIDFVFDDLSELSNSKSKQGMNGISCTIKDGAWDGKDCVGLDETQCNDLATAMKQSCPDCTPVRFENGLCIAPDGHTQAALETAGKVAATVGGAALTITLIVAPVPGSRAAAAVAFAYLAKTGAVITILGMATETVGDVGEAVIYNKFKNRVAQCHDGECAKQIILDCWDNMQSLKNGVSTGEAKAIAKMFENLFNQVPEDDPFWLEFLDDSMFDENCNFISNNKTHWTKIVQNTGQIMQAVGGVLQIVGATGMFFDKIRIIANNQGSLGVWYRFTDPGPAKDIATRSELLTSMGLKTGAPLNLQQMEQFGLSRDLLRGARVSRAGVLTLANGTERSALFTVHAIPLATKVKGVASAGYATFRVTDIANEATGFRQPKGNVKVPRCLQQTNVNITVEDAGLEEETVQPDNNNNNPDVVPVVVPDNQDNNQNNDDNSSDNNNTVIGGNVINNNINTINEEKPTTFVPKKQKDTGLIVGLTALGLVATGAVIGGVVAATDKNKTSEKTPVPDTVIDPEIEKALNNANGVLGVVGGKQVSLIPLPTTVNTNAKLVDIDKFAVAVVGYDGYKLPYFIKNGRWTPLLGIGEKGRWFNVYPQSSTGIKTIDTITGLMNQQINPNVILRYVGNNASGYALPTAAQSAFGIINAEFPNGVVQNENMTAKDAKLYSDNYNLIKNKLK